MRQVLLAMAFVAASAGVSAQDVPGKCASLHGPSGISYNSCLQALTCSKSCADAACKTQCCKKANYVGTCE
jgi:hypothetical protein